MNELAVESLPPDDLVPYPGNARQHSAEQVRQIARSISEFGFVTAIVVDAQNRVIAGQGRLLAAKTLKLARVPVVRKDTPRPPAAAQDLRLDGTRDHEGTRDLPPRRSSAPAPWPLTGPRG